MDKAREGSQAGSGRTATRPSARERTGSGRSRISGRTRSRLSGRSWLSGRRPSTRRSRFRENSASKSKRRRIGSLHRYPGTSRKSTWRIYIAKLEPWKSNSKASCAPSAKRNSPTTPPVRRSNPMAKCPWNCTGISIRTRWDLWEMRTRWNPCHTSGFPLRKVTWGSAKLAPSSA